VRLAQDRQREVAAPLADGFGRRLDTAVIHDNDFKCRGVCLFGKGTKTKVEENPIVINTDDNAE